MIQMQRKPRTRMRFAMVLAVLASIGLFGGSIVWATLTQINGAVISTGQVVTDGNVRSVQHIDGGVVADILVQNGDRIAKGDVLVRLEDTLLQANAEIYRSRLAGLYAQQARLQAEQLGEPFDDFPSTPLVSDDLLARSRLGQLSVMDARTSMREGRIEQLEERIRQFRNQITGVEGLVASKQEQLSFVTQELETAQSLNERGLAVDSQVLGLQRTSSDLLGQIAEHESERLRIDNSIRDAELEILQISREFQEQVVSELQDIDIAVQELVQQLVATERQLDRIELRAPDAGIVHEMQVFTIGGVIPPGATVVQIVPTEDEMTFDMRVDPAGIDQVYFGQEARVRFPAFNARTTPEINGAVNSISPTTVVDEVSGQPYFRVTLSIPASELDRLGDVDLIPGMPVEAYLQTSARSVLSYLTRPFTDQLERAFREE